MERKGKGRLLSAFVVALVMALGLVLGAGTRAYAKLNPVTYLDEKGEEQTCTSYNIITGESKYFDGGWWVVSGEVSLSDMIFFTGDSHLILCDGAKLDVSPASAAAIFSTGSLDIYAQSTGGNMGRLVLTSMAHGMSSSAAITINGGNVEATGGENSSGITANNGVTINGGSVTAKGGDLGIHAGSSVSINGGTVIATADGAQGSNGIYAGSSVSINGGAVTASGPKRCISASEGLSVAGGLNVIAGENEASAQPVTDPSTWKHEEKWARIAAPVPVASVELDQAAATLEVGETATLKATVKPDDATDKTVTWTSSDEKVATVKDGVVTAVKAGKATITVTSADNEKATASCEVTVTQPVTGVELDRKSATIEAGKTATLKATVNPDDATDKTVTWESSDEKVATVKDGTVTAVAAGKATITARAGDKAATCEVTVTKKDDPKPEPKPDPKPAGAEMFRLYNPYTGEHFYTASAEERDFNVGLGWQDEGVGWVAPEEGEPVFRVYNPYAGDHHYTTSVEERDHLVSVGWNDEGVGWNSAAEEGGVPLWRQYNPNAIAGAHNYTTSEAERDHLVEIGWSDEGVGWYGLE